MAGAGQAGLGGCLAAGALGSRGMSPILPIYSSINNPKRSSDRYVGFNRRSTIFCWNR